MRRLPPTSPEVQDYEHKCFASVHCLSVHAAMVFVLYVMTGSLMSPWGESVIQRAQIFLVLQTKNKVCIIFYFIHEPVRKHWCNLNRFTDKWMALHHENVLMHKLVKRFRFENDEKTFLPFWYFYYFIFMRTLFLPFRFASLPQFSLFTALSLGFSWKRSVFSTRILWLCNRVLRHKTLQQHWRRRRDGTDKQGHKASQTGRECVCVDS